MPDIACTVRPAEGPDDLAHARVLLEAYGAEIGPTMCTSRLAEELGALPGDYARPRGRMLLACDVSGDAVGVVAVRPHDASTCELRRLYVRSDARQRGVGIALVRGALEAARELGYRRVVLSTMPESMQEACRLYGRCGFEPVPRFTDAAHDREEALIAYLGRSL